MRFYVFILFFTTKSFCQTQNADSLLHALNGKKRIDACYNSRNAFINHGLVVMQNVRLGVSFDKKISLGLSYSWLTTKITDTKTFYDDNINNKVSVPRRLSLYYVGLYAEYTYFTSRRWKFSIPMQFGIGKIAYNYTYNHQSFSDNQGYCFVYEPEVDVRFKIWRWVGLEADVGYRIFIQKDPLAKKTFNSPLFSFGVFVSWDEVALLLFPKNAWIQKKFAPSDWD
ncbi:MAG: hypothetical protein JST67_06625 [Bacteroidetes bacterium]|nr:hypothetical protein [Bacteroidota bacterium]